MRSSKILNKKNFTYPRRIKITGQIQNPDQVGKFITGNKKIKILSNNSPCILGLGQWIQSEVNSVRLVFSHTTETYEIIYELRTIAQLFPDINLTVHIGILWAKSECQESIQVGKGAIKILDPTLSKIPRVKSSQISKHLEKTVGKI